MTSIHALAFGDFETQTWAVTWTAEAGAPHHLAIRHRGITGVREAALWPAGETWRLEGEGTALLLRPLASPARADAEDPGLHTIEQLCEVSGELELEGERAEVRSLGWQSTLGHDSELTSVDSFRFLAAWLDPQHGFSLTALRPGRARGHESDQIAAAVIDDPPLPPVVEPRLSTTYAESGLPARVGLELWFQEPEEAEAEDSPAPQYPRRAAGELVDPGPEWSQNGFRLRASLLRWHSRGQEGPGVYLLGERQ